MLKKADHFKKCSYCSQIWHSRDLFLADKDIKFNGYQADFESPEEGLFLFTHHLHKCGTTLAVQVSLLQDLYKGPVYTERKMNSEECPSYCMNVSNFERCETKCECAYVRKLIQIVNEWDKKRAPHNEPKTSAA